MTRMKQRSYTWIAWGLVLSAMTAASAQDSTSSAQQLPDDPAIARLQTAPGTAQGANNQRLEAQAQQQQQNETPGSLGTTQGLPNDPGASRPQTAEGATQSSNDQQPAGAQAQQQQQPQQNQNQTQAPVGTAAAPEAPAAVGVAASKPAGAAIAPAKQRRSRAFFIKLSAIVGGAAAIGTVAALSKGSPSKPPGAH